MKNVAVAFDILDHVKPTPVSWTQYSGQIVLDVNMDFNWEAQWLKYYQNTL